MARTALDLGDQDIRAALHSELLLKYPPDSKTVIVHELGLCRGRVRVDVAVVNGILHGYEIKSDRDNLRRLRGQVEYYSKTLDRATLVVGQRHFTKALEMLPDWWGIITVQRGSQSLRLKTHRLGHRNPRRDPRSLVELLWLEDAVALLDDHQLARGIRGKPRKIVWDRICEYFTPDDIGKAVRESLRARLEHQAPPPPS